MRAQVGEQEDVPRLVAHPVIYRIGAFRLGVQARELGLLVKNGCPSPKHRDAPLISPGRQREVPSLTVAKTAGLGKCENFRTQNI